MMMGWGERLVCVAQHEQANKKKEYIYL
jgi:hypothetical protein